MIGMNRLGSKGRLGNQMFQYASLVGIAKNMGYDYCIPDHSKTDWFHKEVDGNIITVYHQLQHLFELNNLNGRFGEVDGFEVEVHQHEFCEELFNECPDNASLYGHFESYEYFKNAENEVRSDFVIRDEILSKAVEVHNKNNLDHPVCVSVRRGDFIKFQDNHSPCTESYYDEAMNILGKERQYLITSDDIEWCKTIFVGNNFTFNDTIPDGVHKGHFDMAVGSLCSDFIISNSTFSWWISYLGNDKNKKIIAPDPWFGPNLSHLNTDGYYLPSMTKLSRRITKV